MLGKIARASLSALLAVAFVPAAAMADEEAQPQGEVVEVSSVDDIRALAERVSGGDSMEGVTVLQTADIDWGDSKFFPGIGTYETPFKGTYNGQNYTLSKAYIYRSIQGSGTSSLGLFCRAEGATFENVVLRDINVCIHTTALSYESMLCPVMTDCTVRDCDIQGYVGAEAASSLYMGGLCVTANNCVIENTVVNYAKGTQATNQFAPAYPPSILVREASNNTVIRNCVAQGDINSSGNAAGLVSSMTNSTVENCVSEANVTASVSSGAYAGGLVGSATNSTISKCVNKGVMKFSGSNTSGCVGGLVGSLKGSTLSDCINTQSLTMTVSVSTYSGIEDGSAYAAGLVGSSSGNSAISRCVNLGDVTNTVTAVRHGISRVGGLVGVAVFTKVSDCYSTGNVKAACQTTDSRFPDSKCSAGGFAANADFTAEFSNCYNAGAVQYEFLAASSNEPAVDAVCPEGDVAVSNCVAYRGSCDAGTGLCSVRLARDMMTRAAYEGWDFDAVWKMDEGEYRLPVLQWETEAHPQVLTEEIVPDSVAIAPIAGATYNGKAHTPAVSVIADGVQLDPTDYAVTYSGNVSAGTARVSVELKGRYVGSASAAFAIAKANPSMTAKAKKAKLKRNKKKAQTTAITVTGAQGKVTFKSNKKAVKVSSKGKVTIKKGFKGTAKITVKCAGNGNYNPTTKTVTIKVK